MSLHSEVGKKVIDLNLLATNNIQNKLSDFKNKSIVLFFYPKDNTPVCTSEAKEFKNYYQEILKLNAVVFGISRDSITSHEKFKEKLNLPFELISDTTEEFCNYFDVLKIKNFFGKKIRGIVRSTFLIDKDGILSNEWRKIKVKGHLDEVLSALIEINNYPT